MAHILVVDDDEQFREMLTQMLAKDFHKVTFATDGKMGLDMAQRVHPDLIITDILMPNKDGIEMILELTRLGLSFPIIAVSGGRRSIHATFNLESASMLGAHATLAKPFTREELRDAIRNVLS